MSPRVRRLSVALLAGVALSAVSAVAASAQGGDGYLFRQPRVSLGVQTGYGLQQTGGQLYADLFEEYTLGERDFDGPYLGLVFAVRLSEQLDLAFAAGWQKSSTLSESRPFVDQDGLPITQVTELQRVPVTAGVRYYLAPRGRSLGRFAWVPRTVAPYVTGNVGLLAYELEQFGDFVDYQSLDIYYDDLSSRDAALLMTAGAGVDISLGAQFIFTLEGQYGWSNADMAGDFALYDSLDLDGARLTGGLAVRF